jgi:anaerobic magnesium-protoporphyrin IX monomethyl ester cyclase
MGLLMLGAVLQKAGYDVHLLDANAANRKRTLPEIVSIAEKLRPDIIGITIVTPLAKQAYRLAVALRPSGAKLIAGGPHATLLPEEPLDHGFDAVVVGEGELTIVDAVEATLGRKPIEAAQSLVYRDANGKVLHNAICPPPTDLDSLPAPARHLITPADFGPADGQHLIFTSRGCPGRCAYCAGGLFGKKFRFRSADSVIDELIGLNRDYGTKSFYFVDDAMTIDRDRMRRICRRMIDEHLGFTWSMMTRIDAVDEELLDLASRAGCVGIDYGVESGNPETLKNIHKPHTIEMVRRVIPLTCRYGIRPTAFFILGFPWEDVQATDATLRLMKELSPYVSFQPAVGSILVPFPGTEIYERFKDEYGLSGWWLSDDRTYDAPRFTEHPFYQLVMYRLGVILDADFFRYSPEMKAKIHEVFRFMLASNLRRKNVFFRTAALVALDLSKKLDDLSPRLERLLFMGPRRLWQLLKGLR